MVTVLVVVVTVLHIVVVNNPDALRSDSGRVLGHSDCVLVVVVVVVVVMYCVWWLPWSL